MDTPMDIAVDTLWILLGFYSGSPSDGYHSGNRLGHRFGYRSGNRSANPSSRSIIPFACSGNLNNRLDTELRLSTPHHPQLIDIHPSWPHIDGTSIIPQQPPISPTPNWT